MAHLTSTKTKRYKKTGLCPVFFAWNKWFWRRELSNCEQPTAVPLNLTLPGLNRG